MVLHGVRDAGDRERCFPGISPRRVKGGWLCRQECLLDEGRHHSKSWVLVLHSLMLCYIIRNGAFQKNKFEVPVSYFQTPALQRQEALKFFKALVSLCPGRTPCTAHVWLRNCWTLQIQHLSQGCSISSPVSGDSAMSSSYQKSLCSQVFCRLLSCNNNNRKVQKLVI